MSEEVVLRPYLSAKAIHNAVSLTAHRVSMDYRNKNPVILVVLKGAFIFAADLVRELDFEYTVEFVCMKTYQGELSIYDPVVTGPFPDVTARHVLIIEDIVDTGKTLSALIAFSLKHSALSVKSCALLDKPSRRLMPLVSPDYKCFEIPDVFVVGYGLDLDEKFRGSRGLWTVDKKEEHTANRVVDEPIITVGGNWNDDSAHWRENENSFEMQLEPE